MSPSENMVLIYMHMSIGRSHVLWQIYLELFAWQTSNLVPYGFVQDLGSYLALRNRYDLEPYAGL